MKNEVFCKNCNHPFHYLSLCDMMRCECDRSWGDEGIRDLSGYCFAYNHEEALHEGCPGKDYPYPCGCWCHDDYFTSQALTQVSDGGSLNP